MVAGGWLAARERVRSPSDAAPTRIADVGMEQVIAAPLGEREEVSVKLFFRIFSIVASWSRH